MFLHCSSYAKQAPTKPQLTNQTDKPSLPNPDQFVFSDFFIRKRPKVIDFKNANPQTERQNDKHQNYSMISKETFERTKQKSQKEMTVFALPNKTTFQIKLLHQKNRKDTSFNSALQQQGYPKFKDKKEMILKRKIVTNHTYTPRPSSRYSKPSDLDPRVSPDLMRNQKRVQRKSIETSSNLAEIPDTAQKGEISFVNAYRVKSLVLGKNPKEQLVSKSKQSINSLFDKRNRNKKGDPSQTKSEKPSDKKTSSVPQTSRINTQYWNNTSNNIRLRSSVKQNLRKSTKLTSIFQNADDYSPLQETFLQPWAETKDIENFNDDVDQLDINFSQENNRIELNKIEINEIDAQTSERKNFFRKIYATRQNKQDKTLKATIFSHK